ncbi:RNA polymerase sigma factor [Solitalea canadensis]|uniref:RNA polymerase sigma-70 factor, Bacteroides expansion family 1 n=1 Tax=Solitalea canadensis (strain ATCC 29591 / DSM 3403 / JCM 21819 / LMG 8368 / NBRC 15130 / NCIMB 12057 / USAM 9D) TaxID=929556 RepID=H8KUB6_SOLCM|nr:RNA polymerase sigma-70 factor [Solitalea canadensis]AFD07228.1 RNA polymerase sigma-70 factor, Bacteroides expansion family 1 [Solitalea canadensis DSM 3403]
MTESTDSILLGELQKGNLAGFDEIYTKYWRPLYRTAYRILKDEQASEDVVQETFIRFWENRDRIVPTNIKGWLCTTSYRLVLKSLKQIQSKDNIEVISFGEPLAEEADQRLHVRQLQLQIDQCVADLPEQSRKVFTMSRYEELSVKNIAQKLGISPKTVEGHVTLALKKLRNNLRSTIIPLVLFFL